MNFQSSSFLTNFSWGNSSVLPSLRQKAEVLKELEEITEFEIFSREDAFKIEDEAIGLGVCGNVRKAPWRDWLLSCALVE